MTSTRKLTKITLLAMEDEFGEFSGPSA